MRRGAPRIPLLAMNRDLDPRNRYSEGVGEACERIMNPMSPVRSRHEWNL